LVVFPGLANHTAADRNVRAPRQIDAEGGGMKDVPLFQLAETELQEGTTLIEASAGTGKTYTIAGLFLRLILERDLSVREILVVTYTVAATEELRHRIRQTLTGAQRAFAERASENVFLSALLRRHAGREADLAARLRRALDGFDEAPIYTIHGFCQRVLKDRAFETGSLFDTELVTDQTPLLRQAVEDYWRRHFYRAGRLPVIISLKHGLSPETLRPLIRDSLSRPFLRLLSPVEGRDAESLAADLERVFQNLRETWRGERDRIRSHFGSGAKWANRPYNHDELMAEAFRQVDACLGALEFPPAALEALEIFRSSAIAAGASRRAKLPPPQHRFFDLCNDLARAAEHYLIGVKLDALRYVERELPRRKNELKIQFYDDLLRRVHDALKGGGGGALATAMRRQYRAALIDEFQDTDPLQYEIFRRVFAAQEGLLFLIGDPKQAIYGFRGADVFTYLTASAHASQRYTLRENWRSESALVRLVNTIFGGSARPFVLEDIRFRPVVAKGEADKKPIMVDGQRPPALQLWFWRRTAAQINRGAAGTQLPPLVVGEIARLLNGNVTVGDRRLLPEDIAVLVPLNRQAQQVQAALAERGVPSVLYTDANLFESREVLETQRLLAAVADPTREAQLSAALATDLMGYTGARLEAMRAQEQEWQQILERFRDYLELWVRRGFIQMFRSFMQREQVRTRLLAFPDGERRLTNLLHLSEVLHRASVEHRLGITGLLKWIGEQREAQGPVAEEHQLRLETDEKAVKLATVHKSKGLEYPVVFCPFSWRAATIEHGGEEQVFFHDGGLVRDLGSPDYEAHRQQARVECLAEEVRKLYVALTRAKHRCYFVWGAFRDAATSAPAWLLHPPPDAKPDPVAAQEQHFPELDDDRILADLHRLAEESCDDAGRPAIETRDLPEPTAEVFSPTRSVGPGLQSRRFTGAIARDWRISSFSSLTADRGEELPDHDEIGPAPRAEMPASGIFAFPGGAKPGTALHKILEKLEFNHWNQPATGDLVREQLRVHGLPEAEFAEAIMGMLANVMTAPLDERLPGLALEKLAAAQCLHELEFLFPLRKVAPEMIGRLLREHRFFERGAWEGPGVRPSPGAAVLADGEVSERQSVRESPELAAPGDRRTPAQSASALEPEGLSFFPVQGMLKGFIDLVFEFAGRFYLLDWKSNLLASRIEDYNAAALAGEIRRRHYYFQYQLYTVALDRYLRLRVPGYRYERHFGGVYYLFLRGIDPAHPQSGIYRDRLSEPLACALARLLIGEDNGDNFAVPFDEPTHV
jgi:exodeoxyribonuclease V beta subunit